MTVFVCHTLSNEALCDRILVVSRSETNDFIADFWQAKSVMDQKEASAFQNTPDNFCPSYKTRPATHI